MTGFFAKAAIRLCDRPLHGVENRLTDEGVDSLPFYFCKMITEVWKLGWCQICIYREVCVGIVVDCIQKQRFNEEFSVFEDAYCLFQMRS